MKIILRHSFGRMIVCFVLLFRERNKYLTKICKKLGKHWQKLSKNYEMITRKIRRDPRRCIIYVGEVIVIRLSITIVFVCLFRIILVALQFRNVVFLCLVESSKSSKMKLQAKTMRRPDVVVSMHEADRARTYT